MSILASKLLRIFGLTNITPLGDTLLHCQNVIYSIFGSMQIYVLFIWSLNRDNSSGGISKLGRIPNRDESPGFLTFPKHVEKLVYQLYR